MRNDEKINGGYTIVLLLAFLFGALMSLIYIVPLDDMYRVNNDIVLRVLALVLFVNALLVSSLCGLIVQPLTSILFGICTALLVYRFRLSLVFSEPAITDIIILAVLIPFHFLICNIGMRLSSHIRSLFYSNRSVFHKSLITSYTVMLIVAAVVSLLARYIMII